MPTDAPGIAAYDALKNFADAINPNMTPDQKAHVSIFAASVVDNLLNSAKSSQIGQTAQFTGSMYSDTGVQNAPGNPGNPNNVGDTDSQSGAGGTSTP